MRISFLWTNPSRYLLAMLSELARSADVQLVCLEPNWSAPYAVNELGAESVDLRTYPGFPSAETILSAIPPNVDAVVVCSWHIPSYRRVAKSLRGRTTRILFMDNPWLGTPKQILGTAVASAYIQPLYDLVLLPGERQAQFARRLGFCLDSMIWGGYSCDTAAFGAVPLGGYARRKQFLFVGRLSPEKGVGTLAEAWDLYRNSIDEPWELVVAGTGPVDPFTDQTGVKVLGFTQPAALPAVMADVGALVLPSTFEPWGVVVHEATCAGLPVIASYASGAVPHLVEDGVNGFIVEPGSAESLARAMRRLCQQSEEEWDRMCRASRGISTRFSPQRAAANLLYAIRDHAGQRSRR